jgi:hypothetical protein
MDTNLAKRIKHLLEEYINRRGAVRTSGHAMRQTDSRLLN